jgi:hypothetical protein
MKFAHTLCNLRYCEYYHTIPARKKYSGKTRFTEYVVCCTPLAVNNAGGLLTSSTNHHDKLLYNCTADRVPVHVVVYPVCIHCITYTGTVIYNTVLYMIYRYNFPSCTVSWYLIYMLRNICFRELRYRSTYVEQRTRPMMCAWHSSLHH